MGGETMGNQANAYASRAVARAADAAYAAARAARAVARAADAAARAVSLLVKNERTERNEVARAKWIADGARSREQSREQTGDVVVRLSSEIAFAPLGTRNDTLAQNAFTLGLIVREGRIDERRAAAVLERAISEWHDGERDDRKDIDTAMRQLREGMKT
jgi:hypothetical protein